MSIRVHSTYIGDALNPAVIRAKAVDELKGVEFDTLVGTGLSGLLPLALLAEQFECGYAAVRKPDEHSHAGSRVEGVIGDRWLFVDDFISSGATFERVIKAVHAVCLTRRHRTECVGAFLYENVSRVYQDRPYLKRHASKLSDALEKAEAKPEPKPEPPYNVVDKGALDVDKGALDKGSLETLMAQLFDDLELPFV